MIPTQDLKPGQLWLLEAGHQAVLPRDMTTQILISSEDILQSCGIP